MCAVNEEQCCSNDFIGFISNTVKNELDKYLGEEYSATIRAFLDAVSNAFECKCLFTIEWDPNNEHRSGWSH